MSEQLALFDAPAQPRNVKPEPRWLHRLVVKLRKRGVTVYRHGRQGHLVDGVPRSDSWLVHFGTKV